ncbi:MAG: peptide chain release factor 2 [Clostridiales bacterium]|nr:peptide chain release factor 2 [Clostridiales bacterium]
MHDTIKLIGDSLDPAGLEAKIAALRAERESPDFFKNQARAQAVSKSLRALCDKLDGYTAIAAKADNLTELIALVEEEDDGDAGLASEIRREYGALSAETERINLATLLKGEYDASDAILSLHAGAGGTEAQDWTQMLFRMYTRYAEKKGYSLRVLDALEGDAVGYKSVTFEVSGDNAYGYLKAEKGVHRLVRISPFDSAARRHTSFAALEVSPVIERDNDIVIRDEDLRVDTYRSSGAGGQHVNKTESAIRLTHIPTGVVAACQNERSQIQNRETAMKMLLSKLVELREREIAEKASAIKGELKRIEWGSQIRSYVFEPYTLVKDHRTNFETGDVYAVMDGNLDGFITDYLRKS